MADKKQERIEALQVALNNEAREKEFYEKNSQRTKNALGKMMFAQIATEEDEHFKKILALHKRLKEQGQWPETLPLEVKGTQVKDVLKKFVEAVDTSSKGDGNDLEAVKTAIDFETKGELFYAELARTVDNPMEKKFYEFLASMEREHRLSLEDTMEFFVDPSGWYRIKERLNADGG